MDSHLDSESYWNRSTSVAFSFDDDADTVDFSSGVTTITGGVTSPTKWDTGSSIFNDDAISEASFDNNSTIGTLNVSIKSIISDEALKAVIEEQTLDERVITKSMKPEDELKMLRRQVQTTLYNPSSELTAHKLLLGKRASLEVFKSLQEKQALLDTLIENGAGDAIIGVLLFLKNTLNRTNFYKVLQQRPKAFDHYVSYLQQIGAINECVELLQLFGKQHEAVLLQFKRALAINDAVARKQQLIRINEQYATVVGIVSLYQDVFQAALKLHDLIDKEKTTLGKSISLQATPIEVLYACCQKNNNWKEPDLLRLTSPQKFATEQQISPAQFEWTALNERARSQAFADLECIFERTSTWNPIKNKQFHISFSLETAIQRLYELKAPQSVIYIFINKINNASEKLALAQRVKCSKAVIDAMAALKQITELMQLKSSLPERSEEQFYCDNVLKNLQSKRWTTDNIKLKL